ncbi:AraC-like DNA-binding protein [Variovorax boronicumulans]|uniref:helix-turn-helix transcriptional regulator n=1 Tax=Variovorax boronicumulans TaxID=436515 RepID=UPI0027889DA2|nr:AraC family transcriptional regulator [Variovorax boronicumulans]MDQ0068681.1 AraC-like DNA-binding protein [Variovorax boronicumulans]
MITPDLLRRMCHARSRLQFELEPPASVAQLAREAGLSTSHFITQFSALFGQTPLQCRTRARLERAREWLLASNEPATQIGLALGFDNLGSFSRLFTRHFGMPPRVYRRTAEPCVAPLGCVALMNQANQARAGDDEAQQQHLNFGEVAPRKVGQDGGLTSHSSPH